MSSSYGLRYEVIVGGRGGGMSADLPQLQLSVIADSGRLHKIDTIKY